jgi:predicted phosphoribosyltransferase
MLIKYSTTTAISQDEKLGLVNFKTPTSFQAVGLCYEHFPQLTDEKVRTLLRKADESAPVSADAKNNPNWSRKAQ